MKRVIPGHTVWIAATALLLIGRPGLADTNTISAVIPWQGQGQVFPVSTDQMRFLGSIEGIMYVETADGEMDEAFVRCPIVQEIDYANGRNSATGSCMITVSPEDAVFADLRCEGSEGLCRGEITLTGGIGRFEGVTGSGRLTARSPVEALAADLTDGTLLTLSAGILLIPELEVTVP